MKRWKHFSQKLLYVLRDRVSVFFERKVPGIEQMKLQVFYGSSWALPAPFSGPSLRGGETRVGDTSNKNACMVRALRIEAEIGGARFHRASHVINVPHVQEATVISAAHPHHAVPRELCTANDETLSQSHECSSRPDEHDVSDRIRPPSTSLTSNLPEKQADSTVLCGGYDLRADLSREVGPICMPISTRLIVVARRLGFDNENVASRDFVYAPSAPLIRRKRSRAWAAFAASASTVSQSCVSNMWPPSLSAAACKSSSRSCRRLVDVSSIV